MNTAVRHLGRFLKLSALVLALVGPLGGCQRKCQPPATQSFRALSESQWRLAETSDPSVQGLDNFNFLIFNFSRNFSGNIQQVRFNDLYETPYKTFNWNTPEKGLLLIRYQDIAPPTDGGTQSTGGRNLDTSYDYKLGRQLEMWDDRGNYYRLVPFSGIVDPDSDCTF